MPPHCRRLCGQSGYHRRESTDISTFEEVMKATFKMSDLGLLRYYLGLEVTQMGNGISVCQSAYETMFIIHNNAFFI